MRFREIHEIREVRHEEKKEDQNYRKIKPETDITLEEARKFFDQLFGKEESAKIMQIADEACNIQIK